MTEEKLEQLKNEAEQTPAEARPLIDWNGVIGSMTDEQYLDYLIGQEERPPRQTVSTEERLNALEEELRAAKILLGVEE